MKRNKTCFAAVNLIICILLFWACGNTNKVEQTVIPEDKLVNQEFEGSSTSTGLCRTWKNNDEKKQVLEANSLYRENFKQNNYTDGLESWKLVMQLAPGFRKTPFVDGEKMYKNNIENADNENEKQAQIDSLYKLYDERIRCHGEEGLVLQLKGLFIYSVLKDRETAYPVLEDAMNKAGNKTKAPVLKAIVNKYRNDIKKEITTEKEVIPLVEKMKEYAQYNISHLEKKASIESYKSALEDLNKPLADVHKPAVYDTIREPELTNCQDVFNYYDEKYNADQLDLKILKLYYARLTKMNCYKETLAYENIHRQLIEALNGLEPTKASWMQAAIYAGKDKDYPTAIKYYQNAIGLESDPIKQAKIYNYIAASYRGTKEYQKSAEVAKQAIQSNPELGAAYTSLGWAYLGYFSKCGSTKKDKAAVAYVAADMFSKAKSAAIPDPNAQDAFNTAYTHFFTKEELFFDSSLEEGGTIKAGCWIQKSSTIRAQN